jgi:serine/threonine-protein kinase HipA
MLNVYVSKQLAGTLFKPESDLKKFSFSYDGECQTQNAVSLSMPVTREQYDSEHKTLHPVFDMNLPEGALGARLRKDFSKVIPNFDDIALLKIVGRSQIGRLTFAATDELLSGEVFTTDITIPLFMQISSVEPFHTLSHSSQ